MYALTGYPLGHSFSEKYFTEKFRRENIDESYSLLAAKSIEEVERILRHTEGLKGLNVTIPYKEAVMELLDEVSEEAREIGAVNCIKITYDNKEGNPFTVGYNTDWKGFLRSLSPLLRDDVKKALVLGSGGASKAVVYALRKSGIDPIVVSRSPGKGDMTYSQLSEDTIRDSLLIVNTTPLGMYPDIESFPPIPYECVGENHICYDLVYNPEVTAFMKLCAARGAKVKNGLEMLYGQAEIGWEIWNS